MIWWETSFLEWLIGRSFWPYELELPVRSHGHVQIISPVYEAVYALKDFRRYLNGSRFDMWELLILICKSCKCNSEIGFTFLIPQVTIFIFLPDLTDFLLDSNLPNANEIFQHFWAELPIQIRLGNQLSYHLGGLLSEKPWWIRNRLKASLEDFDTLGGWYTIQHHLWRNWKVLIGQFYRCWICMWFALVLRLISFQHKSAHSLDMKTNAFEELRNWEMYRHQNDSTISELVLVYFQRHFSRRTTQNSFYSWGLPWNTIVNAWKPLKWNLNLKAIWGHKIFLMIRRTFGFSQFSEFVLYKASWF